MADLSALIPDHRALGKDIGTIATSLESTRYHLLRVPQAIGCCRVNPVDAGVQGCMDRGYRIIVVLWSPAEFPTASAYGPRTHPQACNLKIAVTELPFVHMYGSLSYIKTVWVLSFTCLQLHRHQV